MVASCGLNWRMLLQFYLANPFRSFRLKLLSAPGHYFRRKNGTVFIHRNLVRVEMSALARFGSR